MAQEIDDQENAIQCVRDGAEQKTALPLRKCDCRAAQPPGQVGSGFQIPDRGKDQQADQEAPSLAVPGAADQPVPERQHECERHEVRDGGDLVASAKADGPGIGIEHGADGREEQRDAGEHHRQKSNRDASPVADAVDPRKEMDGCHENGKPEHLLGARKPVPRPGGIVFHVQGQILLQHPDHEHQCKTGI